MTKYLTLDLVKRIVEEFEWPVEYDLEDDSPDGILMNFPTSSLLFAEESFGRVDVYFLVETKRDHRLRLAHALSTLIPDLMWKEYNWDHADLEVTEGMDPSELKIERGIRNIRKKMQEWLLPFFKGDHSWVHEYEQFYEDMIAIREAIGMDDDHYYKHPIYQKLIRKDPTWKEDLTQLQQHGT
jgi:hypothetical protein